MSYLRMSLLPAPFIKISDSADDESLRQGEKLMLHCTVLANTEYTIKWYKISKTSYFSQPEKNEGNNLCTIHTMQD